MNITLLLSNAYGGLSQVLLYKRGLLDHIWSFDPAIPRTLINFKTVLPSRQQKLRSYLLIKFDFKENPPAGGSLQRKSLHLVIFYN